MPLLVLKFATTSLQVGGGRCGGRVPLYLAARHTTLMQSAGITSAGGKPRDRPYKPFDYRKKLFTHLHQPFDRSARRMDENSKVIVVDGPMASGKHEFGKRLAKQLDFKFCPQADVSALHKVGFSGLSYTDLDELLPEKFRIYQLKNFYNDKNAKLSAGGGSAGWLQVEWFIARLFTYNDALLHLFSTGQGVVCVRSPWSDGVFAKALYDNGYMSKKGYNYYKNTIAKNHLCDFPRPHLTIYLDADANTTLENVKKRNNPDEVNTSVLTPQYMQSIENCYKDTVLPNLADHGELLIYPSISDITDHEVELMVEDIEALGPLAHSGFTDDSHLEDWIRFKLTNEEISSKRREYQNLTLAQKVLHHNRPWDVPEMVRSEYFKVARGNLYKSTPGWKYEDGFDPSIDSYRTVMLGFGSKRNTATDRRHFWIPE